MQDSLWLVPLFEGPVECLDVFFSRFLRPAWENGIVIVLRLQTSFLGRLQQGLNFVKQAFCVPGLKELDIQVAFMSQLANLIQV